MLLRIWRNLDTLNSANLRILGDPSEEWTEPTLKNTALEEKGQEKVEEMGII